MATRNEPQRSKRPKVLLLASAVSPLRGSESATGWHWALETAKRFDTWVITTAGPSNDEVRGFLETRGQIPGLHFIFVSRGLVGDLLMRIPWLYFLAPGLWYLAYNLWHRRAFRVARQLHRQIGFDLVHQVNMCGYREPGYLWKLDVPFVWGPVAGTQDYPWRFLGEAGWLWAVSEVCRTLVNGWQLRFSPRVRRAARRAAVLVAANSTTQNHFAAIHNVSAELLADVGVEHVAGQPRQPDPGRRELRILWSGVLQPRKALSLLIKALARIPPEVPYQLRILGEGPRGKPWRKLASRLGVADRIAWLGWLPREEAIQLYTWADVFVFTSLRDTMGTVVLEALGMALPVICLDHQGVHDVVTPECGIKIPVTNPREVVERLATAIVSLAGDRATWQRLSAGALLRAADYDWCRKGETMAAFYRRVLENT